MRLHGLHDHGTTLPYFALLCPKPHGNFYPKQARKRRLRKGSENMNHLERDLKGFKGVLFEPVNEQECIVLFALLKDRVKPNWCFKQTQTAFPDAIFFDTESKREIRVEFEHLASNFFRHRHDPLACEMIICWADDLADDCRFPNLQVLALKDVICRMPCDDVYLGLKRPGSIDALIEEGIRQGSRSHKTVGLLAEKIALLEKKYPPLFLDRSPSKHYVLRWNGNGMFGIFPDGRLVAKQLKEYINKFGLEARPVGEAFREAIKERIRTLNVGPNVSDEELESRVNQVLSAIETFCIEMLKVKPCPVPDQPA